MTDSSTIEQTDFEADFTFTPTANAVTIAPNITNPGDIWLNFFEIRGVPVTAGIPNDHAYYLRIAELPPPRRIALRNGGMGDCVPLRLNGEVTRVELKYPMKISMACAKSVSTLTFDLRAPDGTAAVYDQCTLHVSLTNKNVVDFTGESFAPTPAVKHIRATIAKPWAR